jgi:hypothetical protein
MNKNKISFKQKMEDLNELIRTAFNFGLEKGKELSEKRHKKEPKNVV